MRTIVRDRLEFDVLATGLGFPEGPVVATDGSVMIVDIYGARVLRVREGGEIEVLAVTSGGPNGMALQTPTLAVVANNGGVVWTEDAHGIPVPADPLERDSDPPGFCGGWVERIDLKLNCVTVIHEMCAGRALRSPNDLVFDEVGGLWVTDHGKARRGSIDRGGLYYIAPDSSTIREVVFPLFGPNGVGLSPDGRRVYVAETHTGRLWAWDLECPGSVRAAGGWSHGHGGVCIAATPFTFDSLAVESDGRIVVAALGDGVVAITPDGGEMEVYPFPGELATNIAFGGQSGRRAVITLSGTGTLAEALWPRPGVVIAPPMQGPVSEGVLSE